MDRSGISTVGRGEALPVAPRRDDLVDAAHRFGKMARERVADRPHLPHEDAGVPQIAAALHERLGAGAVGLLREATHAVLARPERIAALDVAVARLRRGRLDADRHQELAARRQRDRPPERLEEAVGIADVMIGRKHDHGRARIDALDQRGGERDRRRGVAAHRLYDDLRGGHVGKLLAKLVGVIRAGHHPDARSRHHAAPAAPRSPAPSCDR